MKHLLPTLLAALFFGTLTAQNLKLGWGYTNGSTGADGANDLAIDAAGNTYVTGYFSGTVDFDKGPGTANLSVAAGQTAKDAFVLKLDPQGNYVWAIRIGGSNSYDQEGTKIALDQFGNVVVAGKSFGQLNLPGGTSYSGSTTNPAAFMVKMDSAGTAFWSKVWGSTNSDIIIEDFVIDANNHIAAVGGFTGTVDLDPGTATSNVSSGGLYDMFAFKLAQNGNYMTSISLGNANYERVRAIENFGNNFVLVGQFKGTLDFDPGTSLNSLTSTSNSDDAFILLLNNNLGYLNAYRFGGSSFDVVTDIFYSSLQTSFFVCGLYGGTADLDPNPASTQNFGSPNGEKCFLLRLDFTASLVWGKVYGAGSPCYTDKIKVLTTGDIYLNGRFYSTVNFSTNSGFPLQGVSNGGQDGYILHLDATGSALSIHIYGSNTAVALDEKITTIGFDSYDNLTSGGNFFNSVDLDPSPTTTTATSAGLDDMLVLKLISCGDTLVNTTETACGSYTLSNGQAITQSGTYNDTLQTTLGCDSIVARNITINPLPNTALVWQGGTLQLANSITTNTHQWLDCTTGQVISGATGTSYTPTGNGSFAVVVSNGACTDTSVCETLTNFSVPEAANIPVNIYPNPTTGILHLESPQPWERVEVVDMLGKLVLNTKKEDIDLSHLPTGMYLVKVYFEEGVVVERVVKR